MSEKLIVQHTTQQIGFASLKAIAFILGLGLWGGVLEATAQNSHNGCYVENERGERYDLGVLCTVSDETLEPVLQTGDVQVTLRWDTSDDLDLIVVDPAGSVVDFGSPRSPSGGQLDVDANGFCQTQSFTPVENIFWPNGGAPNGEYLAYVTLAIPCSLEGLASADINAANNAYETLEVPYTLTILTEGVITTYAGVSRPEEFGIDYPFQVGLPVETPNAVAPVNERPKDNLELPNFGLPEL